jgi:hypothetical protein
MSVLNAPKQIMLPEHNSESIILSLDNLILFYLPRAAFAAMPISAG